MTHVFLALLAAATLPTGARFTVDPAASAVHYRIVHKLHQVEGESKQLEAKVVVQDGGRVIAMVRIPATSFRSGDGNRDSHMLEVLDADRFPYVVFKGTAQVGAEGLPPGGKVSLAGELEFHGVKRPVTVPLVVEAASGGALHARGDFDVSLDAHQVERPSLLFVKVDDACRISFDLLLRRDAP
jgi:polyisoprenoid-binding protein YceI